MKYDVIKLHFNSPLHLSRGQTEFYDKSETVLHSDTIKSAIFACAKVIYKNKIDKSLFSDFKISSAFPFYKDEYFFPKPLIDFDPVVKGIDAGPKTHKKLKQIEYLSKSNFESFINGELKEIENDNISQNNKFLFSNKVTKRDDSIFKSEVQQRLVMPRSEEENAPKPFYLDRIYFTDYSGLFFLIEFNNEQVKDIFSNSLKLLESQGLGTDRNVGNGQFLSEFKPNEIDLKLPLNAELTTNISTYLPQKEEIDKMLDTNSRYKLIKRGGYISSPEKVEFLTYRKKSIYMFKEGSVFKSVGQKGKIENLAPDDVNIDHPIYRDGTSIFIPLKK